LRKWKDDCLRILEAVRIPFTNNEYLGIEAGLDEQLTHQESEKKLR